MDQARTGFTATQLSERLLHEYRIHCVNGLYRPSYLFGRYRRRGLREGS